MILQELGARIKELREKRQLRQADLAHALQVSPQAVSKWERGENAPDIVIIPDLASVLGTTTDRLLGVTSATFGVFDASVLATDIALFTKKVDGMAPEDVAEYLNGYYYRITESVLKYDAIPVKYMGDSFLCFFAGPNHRYRSIQAALRARTMVDEQTIFGISSGPIYFGNLGHPGYATRDIMGDTINRAFRVNAWGGKNTESGIAATESTAGSILDNVTVGKSEDIVLKGFGEPIVVYEITGTVSS